MTRSLLRPFIPALILSACTPDGPPYSPDDALRTFQLPEGYRIELVASEPLITDPVEIAFDANGHLYVAEMEDYPADAAPGGRIVVLDDKDGDGFYETGHTFADSLPYVNGVMPWRQGVLVTSAPDILYLEDTDGDGRADSRHVVLTGFAFTNPQLRMSSLRYGPDNLIYGAYSRSGGQRGYPQFTNHGLPLTFPDDPEDDSADIYPGTDFRFHPDRFEVEPSGGMSQFGLTFDAEGNRFTVWNNIHLRHVVVDARYPSRNPALAMRSLMAHISDHGDAAPVYSRAENRMDLHESEIGHFTSACGISVYTGGLFPEPYDHAAFVCEPVSNVVHADLLARNGVTFTARRDREGVEFLSSTDSWFRPVNTTVGPDGGLYVVDFYRKLVEHPAWIAHADDKGIYTHAGVLQEEDFLEGNDRGRIYRIVPADFDRKTVERPSLGSTNPGALVEFLNHPNAWWRLNAQRLLVDRGDKSAVPALKTLTTRASAQGKIHALWTLEGLGALDDAQVLEALKDAQAPVRRHALLLAEKRLSRREIRDAVLALGDDEDETVRFQLALTLSARPAEPSREVLTDLLRHHIHDPWFRQAVLFSAEEDALIWFRTASRFEVEGPEKEDGRRTFLQRTASVIGARQRPAELAELLEVIAALGDAERQGAGLNGIDDGIPPGAVVKLPARAQQTLLGLIASKEEEVADAALYVAERLELSPSPTLLNAVRAAVTTASNTDADPEARTHAIRVMGLHPTAIRRPLFDELLSPTQPVAVQAAAAGVLINRDDTLAMNLLLEHFDTFTAGIRTQVEGGFTLSPQRLDYLLIAAERGTIEPALLSRTIRTRLTQHRDTAIRARAGKIFGALPHTDREEVITTFYEATTLPADAAKGKEIFRKSCSACHQLEGVGQMFGPDLLSVRNQTRINLLTMILDPNHTIAQGYEGYVVETMEGHTYAGLLIQENGAGVLLRTADGNDHTLPRKNIKTIAPMTHSLMPEGLETGYTTQDVADLLEYLKRGNAF